MLKGLPHISPSVNRIAPHFSCVIITCTTEICGSRCAVTLFNVINEQGRKFVSERFGLKKLDNVQVKEKCNVEISKISATLERLDESFDITNT